MFRITRVCNRNAFFKLSRRAKHFSTRHNYQSNVEFLHSRYNVLKTLIESSHRQECNVDPVGLFAINQINLREINVYGFDYDYTLAQYSDDLLTFIYDKASEILVKKYHFPKDLMDLHYIPNFCIRGLHYDIPRSLLMKIDACHVIQFSSVYKGLTPVDDEQVLQLFKGSRHIPKHIMDQSYVMGGGSTLRQLMDIFSMPELMLLANVVDYFILKNITYDPYILFESVKFAVRDVHVEGHLFKEVASNIDKYLKKDSLQNLFDYLVNDKQLFLITNSNFRFVDMGMRHLLGKNWREYFQVVVVEAKKPRFFQDGKRPFKQLIVKQDYDPLVLSWDRVTEFQRGKVYYAGCIEELVRISGWRGSEVLYFGDQIYDDLSDPTYSYGWRTGAVIPELEDEVRVMNSQLFGKAVVWVQTLERLLERMQIYRDAESAMLVQEWLLERDGLKRTVKEIFNARFGSVFRSNLQSSYFAARLCRIADVYTSKIENLQHYHHDHFFFPLRGSLPHEQVVSLAYLHDGYDNAIERALTNREAIRSTTILSDVQS